MKSKLTIIECDINAVHPYPGNPRKTAAAIEPVANSLRQFGFRQPIVVDGDNVIVIGHVRHQAARFLGMKTVPVHVAADLTPEQARAYRLADNKTAEYAEWDTELLIAELAKLETDGIDMTWTGFGQKELDALMAIQLPDEMGADADGESIRIPFDKDTSRSGVRVQYLKFGGRKIPITPDESEQLADAADRYVKKSGSFFGFVTMLLGGPNASSQL